MKYLQILLIIIIIAGALFFKQISFDINWYAGLYHYNKDRFEKAIPWFEKAAEYDPSHAEVIYKIGCCYLFTNRQELSIPFFKQVLTLDPAHFKAKNNLGCAYDDLGRRREAVALFEEVVREHPDNPQLRYNLAIPCWHLRDFEKALAVLNTLKKDFPDTAYLYDHGFAITYSFMGEEDQAVSHFSALITKYAEQPLADSLIAFYSRYKEADGKPFAEYKTALKYLIQAFQQLDMSDRCAAAEEKLNGL